MVRFTEENWTRKDGVVANLGSWFNPDNLISRILLRRARSKGVTLNVTRRQFYFGKSRKIQFLGIMNHSRAQQNAKVRWMLSNTAAWSGLKVQGGQLSGATSLNVEATGQAWLQAGDAFRFQGSDTNFQITSGVSLGENILPRSGDLTQWTIPGSDYIITAGEDDPTGGMNAARFLWAAASTGIIRKAVTVVNGTTYNASIYCRLKSSTGTGGFTVTLGAGTPVNIALSELVVDSWVRINVDITAGSGGNFDIKPQASTTAAEFDLWGAQITTGSSVKDYIETGASAINTLLGTVGIEQIEDEGEGLDANVADDLAITCLTGLFNNAEEGFIYDTFWIDLWPEVSSTSEGSPYDDNWLTGRLSEEEALRYRINHETYLPDEVLAAYMRVMVDDRTNANILNVTSNDISFNNTNSAIETEGDVVMTGLSDGVTLTVEGSGANDGDYTASGDSGVDYVVTEEGVTDEAFGEQITVTSGEIEMSQIVVAPLYEPSYDIQFGERSGGIDNTQIQETPLGVEYYLKNSGTQQKLRQTKSIVIRGVTENEVNQRIKEMIRRFGGTGQFFFDYGGEEKNRHRENFMARFDGLPNITREKRGLWAAEINLLEVL